MLPDGSEVEVLVSIPRRDIHEALGVLLKIDADLTSTLIKLRGLPVEFKKSDATAGKHWVMVPVMGPAGLGPEWRNLVDQFAAGIARMRAEARGLNEATLERDHLRFASLRT